MDAQDDARPGRPRAQPVHRRVSRQVRRIQRPVWENRYALAVMATDAVAVAVGILVGYLSGMSGLGPGHGILTATISPVVAVLVFCSLSLTRAWDTTVLGQGAEEFSRVLRAMVISGVVLGLAALAASADSVRPWVFGLVPLIGLLSVFGRWLLRKPLHRRRVEGRCSHAMLAIGTAESVADLIRRTRRDRFTGWVVTGACTPTGTGPDGESCILDVPVVGDLDSVTTIVRAGQHRVVAVSPAPGWTPHRLHQLAWDLEDVGSELVVDPGLMEVAGPRLHVAPVDGLPLLRLTEPTLNGVPRAVKYLADLVGGAAILLFFAPLMLIIAAAVKCDGGGPVFFRQTRVGRDGVTFSMIKFRSMQVGADTMLASLSALNDATGPLFKLRSDPRVTRVGSWLRRYSLDELPQLFNVITGSMSLVGPRPPLPSEVETYSRDAHRKFLVKPGLTGLWQVSGRSDLSWEESVRLDLRYVENWSLAQDGLILRKTIGAVLRRSGAY